MVGFPGESDEEFAESEAFVRSMAFSRLHIFRYSRRQGTPAAELPDPVPAPVARARSRHLHRLAAELTDSFNQTFIGRRLPVLWETSEVTTNGLRWSGLTPSYIRTITETGPSVELLNRITEVEITGVIPGGVSAHCLL
jgi:threonylcarbamoyladenosine tRNA methylthiotransferase MtaB